MLGDLLVKTNTILTRLLLAERKAVGHVTLSNAEMLADLQRDDASPFVDVLYIEIDAGVRHGQLDPIVQRWLLGRD